METQIDLELSEFDNSLQKSDLLVNLCENAFGEHTLRTPNDTLRHMVREEFHQLSASEDPNDNAIFLEALAGIAESEDMLVRCVAVEYAVYFAYNNFQDSALHILNSLALDETILVRNRVVKKIQYAMLKAKSLDELTVLSNISSSASKSPYS